VASSARLLAVTTPFIVRLFARAFCAGTLLSDQALKCKEIVAAMRQGDTRCLFSEQPGNRQSIELNKERNWEIIT
jgi:hypothetical protein